MEIFAPAFSRRHFLRLLGQGAALAALPTCLPADDADAVTISILHTTDLHGHVLPTLDYNGVPNLGGQARCATQLRQWRRANANSILLDIGDIYQGTEVGLLDRGATMIRGLSALNYDAWVVGNHEFDFGADAFAKAVALSGRSVLAANVLVDGKAPAQDSGSLAQIRPYLIRDVAGIRIAIVGLTTPGLEFWLPPENLGPFEALDPIESLHDVLAEVTSLRPDAIVLAGHMGLKRMDDFANQVGALTRTFPQLAACLGGHTHQNQPSVIINNVLYTQADHFGIHVGKLDLTFDRASRRLLHRQATTVLMDQQVALDPLILSLAKTNLAAADAALNQPVGELTEAFGVVSTPGAPSDVERLIASAIVAALRKKGIAVDAVLHGSFEETKPLSAGAKTVADLWTVLPYENEIVTVELSYPDLLAMAQEAYAAREPRRLLGLSVTGAVEGRSFRVDAVHAAGGAPLPVKPTYRIALNAYDAQSGGQRLPITRQLVSRAENHRVFYPMYTREALIDFFVEHGKVGRASLLV